MRDETEIAILASAENGEKYDASCKDLWKHKEMLAPLLRFLVEEYAGMTDDEIIACIDADTISDKDLVDDIPPTVVDRGTEYSSITDKLISYDLHFKAKNPKLSKEDNNRQILVMVHFDLEFQTKYKVTNPEYPIIKRAIYYGARGLSSQLGPLTQKTNYAALEKAYSIWICSEDIPEDLQNTADRYVLRRESIAGKSDEPEEDFDLLEVILIRRGPVKEMSEGIFDYLNAVFSSNLKRIDKYVNTSDNEELRKEVKSMEGLGAAIAERNYALGKSKQLEETRIDLYKNVEERNISVSVAAQIAKLSEEEFRNNMLLTGHKIPE